jgi:hypothetical protein
VTTPVNINPQPAVYNNIFPENIVPPYIPALNQPAGAIPGSGVAAVWTLPATAGLAWAVKKVNWSYSATPAAGSTITISDGTTSFSTYISSSGAGWTSFDIPNVFKSNANVTITLAASAGVFGEIGPVEAWQVASA